MEFSFAAFGVTIAGVLASGVASWAGGTFTNKRVTMGFLNHGGMWGDLTIMAAVSGIEYPHVAKNWCAVLLTSGIAVLVTVIAHAQWAYWSRRDRVTEHVFPKYSTGKWYKDISAAGWMHVVVMIWLLSLTLLYAVSPVPTNVVVVVSLLLTTHVFLALVQPGWYCTRKLWTWRNFGPPVFATFLIWVVAVLKLQHNR